MLNKNKISPHPKMMVFSVICKIDEIMSEEQTNIQLSRIHWPLIIINNVIYIKRILPVFALQKQSIGTLFI